MLQSKTFITLTGGLVLVLATTSCSSRNSMRTTGNSPPPDNVTASDRLDRTTMSSDRMVSTERPVPTNRTGAGDSPYDSDRAVACANQKDDVTASQDCVPQNRPMAGDRTGNDRTGYGYPGQAVSGCAYRRDSNGNVIYDDPTCPTRYRQSHRTMGSSFENVNLTKENAFFDRYIEKAVKHAREAEIAGDQGNAPEMLQHANLALVQAKQAQRAGNVPGLDEGIIELREAMRLALSPSRTHPSDSRVASERTVPCVDQRGDVSTSMDCGPQDRRIDGNVIGNDRTVYDAPTRCTSHTDANGNVIYDDPACSTRYDQSTTADAAAHVREARIRLSEAAGMRSVDTRAPRSMGNINQRSRVDDR
jgi:hypothetical protein